MGMNANAILGTAEEQAKMTLEQKLAAIDAAMANAQKQADEEAAKNGTTAAPIDPADLTMCESCQ